MEEALIDEETKVSYASDSPVGPLGRLPVLRLRSWVLRPLAEKDIEFVFRACQDEKIAYFMNSIEVPFTMDSARRLVRDSTLKWISGESTRFAFYSVNPDGTENEFLGVVGYSQLLPNEKDAVISGFIAPWARKTSISGVGLQLVVWMGFSLFDFVRQHGFIFLDNGPSRHTTSKYGGLRFKQIKDRKGLDGQVRPQIEYEISRAEYYVRLDAQRQALGLPPRPASEPVSRL